MMVQRMVPNDGNRTSMSVRVRTEANALRNLNIRGGMEHSLVSQFRSNSPSSSKLGNLPPSWCIKSLDATSIRLPSVGLLLGVEGYKVI